MPVGVTQVFKDPYLFRFLGSRDTAVRVVESRCIGGCRKDREERSHALR